METMVAPAQLRDERLVEVKDTNTPRTLKHYSDLEVWKKRAAYIKEHILVCLGLWPLPEKTALKPRVFDRLVGEGFSVEKVFFASRPGFFVCANLYRPLGKGPFPGIVSPHGHWARGRLENSALGSIPGRCINLARQGHVVLAYDMVGYIDSDQVNHRSFGGPQQDLWGIGAMGLQLWNSIRAVDFISGLEDVDPKRIGVTGASGGGTQSFILSAVDPRIAVAAPVNMVSAFMQGGCNCENQGHLRLDIDNVEIAATFAPKPQLLVSTTGDWTVNVPQVEYPAIRQIYNLYGAADQVQCHQEDAPHNYNRGSREAVYRFFARTLLGKKSGSKCGETPFVVPPDENLRVFSSRSKPANSLDEAALTQRMVQEAGQRIAALKPRNSAELRKFQRRGGTALQHALGVSVPSADQILRRDLDYKRGVDFGARRMVLGRATTGEEFGALLFEPWGKKKTAAALLVHGDGAANLADLAAAKPGPIVAGLLKKGLRVLLVDPFVGEPQNEAQTSRLWATYNQAAAACRVQDVLTGLSYLAASPFVGSKISLAGFGQAGLWCLFAGALAPGVKGVAVDFDRFAADDDQSWQAHFWVPAIRAVGDVKTALALLAGRPLTVWNSGRDFPQKWTKDLFRFGGKASQLTLHKNRLARGAVIEWLAQL